MGRVNVKAIGIALGVLFLLTGCSPFVDRDQTAIVPEAAVRLEPGHPVGQTFVARHGGLNGIEFWLEPEAGTTGRLLLHLRSEPQSTADLAVSALSLDGIAAPGFYRFSLPRDNRSHSTYRYAFLELEGTGVVRIGAASGEAYLDGAAYRDHEPLDAQLAFRLTYDPWGMVVDLIVMVTAWIGYGLLGITVLFLSGYWIVRGWAHRNDVDFTVILIVSVTSALALWMLLLVWSDLFKIRLDMWRVRLALGTAMLTGLLFFIKDRQRWNREFWLGKDPFATLMLWLVVAYSIGLRLWIGRGLVMLPGCDAYHHTLIVQLFAEQGGIPDNYEPYAPLQSFSYHFGFHSIVALFRWLLKSELLPITKVIALVLNGGIAATTGLFGEQIAGHRRAGIVAAALVGLIMVSPFCLLRWSRFTQTAGLFFLPIALLALIWDKKEAGLMLPSLLIAAVFFAHSRVALMLGVFAIVRGGIAVLQGRKDSFKQVVIMGIISLTLASPWLLRVLWVQYDPYGLRITYPLLAGYNNIQRIEEPVLHFLTNWPVLFSTLALTITACLGRKRTIALMLTMWCVVLVGGALFSGEISFSFWDLKTTVLSLAIPFAGLAGLGVQSLKDMLPNWVWIVIQWLTIVFLIIGIIGAGIGFPRLIYTAHIYLRPGDLIVMEWIQRSLPSNALFVVNNLQFEWNPGWMVGSDAGYWIPLLARRDTLLPPMLYPLEWSDPTLSSRLHQWYIDELLKKRGSIYYFASTLLPSVSWLPNKDHLKVIYQQDHIRVFEMIR